MQCLIRAGHARFFGVAVIGLVMAGCNTSGPAISTSTPAQPLAAPPVGGPAVAPPLGAPSIMSAQPVRGGVAPSQQHVLHSQQTQKVTVSADGRTVRTDTTRTSVSVDPTRAAATVGSMLAPAPSSASQGLPGVWKAYSSSSRETCTVQLHGAPDAMAGTAASSGCSYGGALHSITGWQFAGGQLHLRKGGETSLSLNALAANRYDGKLTWGVITTTISLYR